MTLHMPILSVRIIIWLLAYYTAIPADNRHADKDFEFMASNFIS